jgi:ABC-type histidine transport system ATPase subunit
MTKPYRDAPTLQVRGLRKSFGSAEVLRGIDFSACEREVISIIGSSGSGKSTLLRCLNLLEVPQVDEFLLKGQPIPFTRARDGSAVADPAHVQRLRRSTAMVFQQFNLWTHWTAWENVYKVPHHVHGRPLEEAQTLAMHYLAKVGMAEKRDAYPSQLSGGQQQRVAIARALACEPEILLFDEPTSALDPELVAEVLGIMRTLAAEGRTMLVVTHEMRFAREVSSRVIFLREGQIAAEGSPDSVFTSLENGPLRSFLGRS